MTQTVGGAVDALRDAISGAVLVPGDADYDEARTLWNAAIDRRPAVIARCSNAADVAAAVGVGVESGLEIAVRGGAHGVSGKAVVDDGLMIDLTAMNSVAVDATPVGSVWAAARCWPTWSRRHKSTRWRLRWA